MNGLFLPDGSWQECSPAAPQVEWRRLAGEEPYRIRVEADPVRVVLVQRYVDERGTLREQTQEFREAGELAAAIAVNDYVAAVRGRIAEELSDVAIALGVPESELERYVEVMTQRMHGDSSRELPPGNERDAERS